jgi:hypothetical protein
MDLKHHHRPVVFVVSLVLAGLLAWPAGGLAQLGGLPVQLPTLTTSAGTVTGQAAAVQASVLGILGTVSTTTLSGTGSLASANDALDASQLAGNIPSLLGAEALQADTIGLANEVDSEASLAGLNLTIAGIPITADFVGASAVAISGAAGSATSEIDNLAINGVPIGITGAPNQTVAIPGGQLVINEQTISSNGSTVVNALHVTVSGIADVVLASATAAIP